MKKLCFVFMLSFFSAITCCGSAVLWDRAVFMHWYDDIYAFGVTAPDGGGIGMDIKVTTLPTQAILNANFDFYTLGYGIILLQVGYNTLVDRDLFSDTSQSFFWTLPPLPSPQRPISETDVKMSLYETVYLAFAINGYYSTTGEFDASWYGWIALTWNGTGFDVSSAMETSGLGIFAGTGNVVPEPSTVILALSGFSLLLLRRRCRK